MDETITRMANEINAAIKEGYFPVEDVLNGPRTRVIPAKIKCQLTRGETEIHMISDIPGKEPYSVYANKE